MKMTLAEILGAFGLMTSILLIALICLEVWAIANAAKNRRVGWAIFIFLVPGIAAVIYLLFGGKK
jgi:hypothetical protein